MYSIDFAGLRVRCSCLVQNGMRDRKVSFGINALASRRKYAFMRSRNGVGGGRSGILAADRCFLANNGHGTPLMSQPQFQHRRKWSGFSSPHWQQSQLIGAPLIYIFSDITITFTKLPSLMNHVKTRCRQLWCNVLLFGIFAVSLNGASALDNIADTCRVFLWQVSVNIESHRF